MRGLSMYGLIPTSSGEREQARVEDMSADEDRFISAAFVEDEQLVYASPIDTDEEIDYAANRATHDIDEPWPHSMWCRAGDRCKRCGCAWFAATLEPCRAWERFAEAFEKWVESGCDLGGRTK